jgi:tetratricopeptide (TPR) repeat protein
MWGRWVVIAIAVVALAGGVALALETLRFRRALGAGKDAIQRGEMAAALKNLEAVAAPGRIAREPEYAYYLGLARWANGRRAEALAAFEQVPAASRFATRAAFFQVEAAVAAGRLSEAEARLRAVRAVEPRSMPASQWLERVYRIEARFDEVRRLLLERLTFRPDNPAAVLRALWRLDRGTVPLASIAAGLDMVARARPDDARVALGKARLALLSGRTDEAETWLRRCPDGPDDAGVQRAWLDWGAATDRADVVIGRLERLGPAELLREEEHRWRVWLSRRLGDSDRERQALESWLEDDPGQTRALERLADLAIARGDRPAAERLRAAKSRIDRALVVYDRALQADRAVAGPAERAEMARLAREAGRPIDAGAWSARDAGAESLARLVGRELGTVGRDRVAWADEWGTAVGPRTADPALPPAITFRDDAPGAGLAFTFDSGQTPLHQMPEPLGGGVGLIDYDGDGWLDVYCVQGGRFPPPEGAEARAFQDRLFRNRRDATFEDVTEATGLARLPGGYGYGVAVGDYDDDGHPDLFVTRWRSCTLYRNRGDGTFEDATERAGLSGDPAWPTSAAFADLDGDGDLDLYVCRYLRWDERNPKVCRDAQTSAYISCSPRDQPALTDLLLRNDGGRFVDVTEAAGLARIDADGRGLGVLAAHLDDDRRIDLFVANDMTANFLLRDRGTLQYEDDAPAAGVAGSADGGYRAGMGVACGDLNGDGRPELAVTNFYGEGTTLYQALGQGLYADRSTATGVAAPSRYRLGFGAVIADFNNDRRNDLLTANGHLDQIPDIPYKMPLQLFAGQADGTLRDVTDRAGEAARRPRLGRGLALGDLDNDGRLDAVVIDQNAPVALLRNTSEGAGHWVTLALQATATNRDAVGAVVALVAGGGRQVDQRIGGGSYLSASDPRLHFGLGGAERVESVEVTWPSGRVDRFGPLDPDKGYRLREGAGEAEPLAGFEGRP